MEKPLFIKTADQDTKEELIKAGYELYQESNGVFTFINDTKKVFSYQQQKVTYTNKLDM